MNEMKGAVGAEQAGPEMIYAWEIACVNLRSGQMS